MGVWYEEKLGKRRLGDIGEMIFAGRYMILLMGVFAVYMGFIYNDIFSLTLPTFGTSWKIIDVCEVGTPPKRVSCEGLPAKYRDNSTETSAFMDRAQPFGLDPAWHIAKNSLPFQNSMKMKFSVILGISQMIFGVFLKTSNAIYFRKPLDFFFECIPMLVFAFCFFGYMLFLIFKKWSIDWNNSTDGMPGPNGDKPGDGWNPPALINTLINMALSPGKVKDPLYGRAVVEDLFNKETGKWPTNYTVCDDPEILCCTENGCGQAVVQWYLLIFAGLSVPIILCCKPCILWRIAEAKKNERERHRSTSNNTLELPDTPPMGEHKGQDELEDGGHGDGHDNNGHGGHGEGFGDLMIHQTIETIEFVLGFISNTASYLRLWALSLAHAELAEVFWEKSMKSAINYNNFLA